MFTRLDNDLLGDHGLHQTVGALHDPHVAHTGLQLTMSTQAARQERRRRSGDNCSVLTMSLSPQPALDVQESVGDVEPGVEEGDVIAAGGLEQGEYNTYLTLNL